jgi:hypothetical protein
VDASWVVLLFYEFYEFYEPVVVAGFSLLADGLRRRPPAGPSADDEVPRSADARVGQTPHVRLDGPSDSQAVTVRLVWRRMPGFARRLDAARGRLTRQTGP